MANARSIEIRDAIVTYLNSQSFPLAFTAQRAILAMLKHETITQITSYVAPQTITPNDSSRTVWDFTYEFAITTVMPLTSTPGANEEDDLIAVVEQIQSSLLGVEMAGAKYITNESAQALFEEGDYADASLFLGTVVVTYLDKS